MMSKLRILIVVAFAALMLALPVSAQEESVNIYVNGELLYQDQMFLINDTTYAPFEEIYYFITGELPEDIVIEENFQYIIVNGRYLYNNSPCLDIGGTLFVPIRSIATAFDATITWNEETASVSLDTKNTTFAPADELFNDDQVYWLSRIIHAEALGESLEGKLGVGSVILNRVASERYPGTIYDVIFDTAGGVQFSPIANGAIYNTPSEESILAAKICLSGYSVSDSVLYFLNESIAASTWIVRNCVYEFTIGNHSFYS